jgi:hypothetical protein
MAHGPDTEILLLRMSVVRDGCLNLTRLDITSLPELPSHLEYLWCNNTQLTSLPLLPSGLKFLHCEDTPIRILPELPSGLTHLYCRNTNLTELPTLPHTLWVLSCKNTTLHKIPMIPKSVYWLECSYVQLMSLPEFPTSLTSLYCTDAPSPLDYKTTETIRDFIERMQMWKEDYDSKKRCNKRSSVIKEDLIAEVFHPRRIQKLIEAEGIDILESM